MRIAIDAHHINGKPQGSRTYLIELLRALSREADDHLEIDAYSFDPLATDRLVGAPNITHRRIFPRSAKLRLTIVAPLLQARNGHDLFHSQYIAPPIPVSRSVVSIHDILFETHPNLFEGAFSKTSVWLIRRSATKARLVITGSDYSRNAILEHYRIAPERVLTIPDGVDRGHFRPIQDEQVLETTRKRYRLDRPFVFAVGRLEPRKNLIRLMEAFELARKAVDRDLQLVLVGAKDFRHQAILDAMSGYSDNHVRWLGAVPDDDLPVLYNLARMLTYPSLVEGFGMPVVEAMACGTPVLCSAAGSLAEVSADAAVWVEPNEVESIRAGMERLLTDEALRRTLRAKGLERSREFDWATTARKTLAAYRDCVAFK